MRKTKKQSGVYSYLVSIGLQGGSQAEIEQAKKEYWKVYKAKWRNLKRKKEKEVTVSLKGEEFRQIAKEAKRHKLGLSKFLKEASLSYIQKSYLVPNNLEVRKIAQLLSMTHNLVQEAVGESKVNRISGLNMLEAILSLEQEILPLLKNPKTLSDGLKLHIEKNPDSKAQLLELITSL